MKPKHTTDPGTKWADILPSEGEIDSGVNRSLKVKQTKNRIDKPIEIDAVHPDFGPTLSELARPIGAGEASAHAHVKLN